MMTAVALKKFSVLELAMLVMMTECTAKSLWPTPLGQCVAALLLCAVVFEKIPKLRPFWNGTLFLAMPNPLKANDIF